MSQSDEQILYEIKEELKKKNELLAQQNELLQKINKNINVLGNLVI